MNRKRFPVSKKFLRQEVCADEFVLNLAGHSYVEFEDLKRGETYTIYVNNCKYAEDGYMEPGMDSFYKVTGLCTGIKRFGGEILYAKFNIKGGSDLIRGNYGLIYYCTRQIH